MRSVCQIDIARMLNNILYKKVYIALFIVSKIMIKVKHQSPILLIGIFSFIANGR